MSIEIKNGKPAQVKINSPTRQIFIFHAKNLPLIIIKAKQDSLGRLYITIG